jgi:hypothetical protein
MPKRWLYRLVKSYFNYSEKCVLLTFNKNVFYPTFFKFETICNTYNILQNLGKFLGPIPDYMKQNGMLLYGRKHR